MSLVTDLAARPMLWRVLGLLPATLDGVVEALLLVRPGRVSYDNALVLAELPEARLGALSVSPGAAPGTWEVAGGEEPIELVVDRDRRAIALRHRHAALYRVEPAPDGSLVRYGIAWVRQWSGAADAEVRMLESLAQTLRVVADQLGVDPAAVAVMRTRSPPPCARNQHGNRQPQAPTP
jgi:hypothetical protein